MSKKKNLSLACKETNTNYLKKYVGSSYVIALKISQKKKRNAEVFLKTVEKNDNLKIMIHWKIKIICILQINAQKKL